MIVESGRLALARQQYTKAEALFDSHRDELTQLKVETRGKAIGVTFASVLLGSNDQREETRRNE